MDVSIVIVSHNVADFLDKCLISIKKETSCMYEIFVIDNNSKDDSIEIVRVHHPEVKIIQNQNNEGFAKANNRGIMEARGRYIFLLNPDTVILDRAIDKLVKFMDRHQEAGACGPKNLNGGLSLQYNCHHFPSLFMALTDHFQLRRFFPNNKYFGRESMTYWNYDEIKEVDWITGCSLMIRKEVTEKIGYLDGNYFMYSEECDFCYRLKKNKFKTLFYPQATIMHYGGASSGSQSRQNIHSRTVTRYLFESRYYFFRKNYGRSREFLLRALDIAYFGMVFTKNQMIPSSNYRQEKIKLAKIALHSALN